jgi:hypothetical protein
VEDIHFFRALPTVGGKLFATDNLAEQMKGKVWLRSQARSLVDEIPSPTTTSA